MFFLIFAIVILFIAMLLFLPIKADVSYLLYKNENRLRIKVGIISAFITVFDSQKNREKKSADKKTQKEEPPKKEEEKKKGKIDFGYVRNVLDIVSDVFDFLKKKLVIETIRLHFHIGTGDAAQTGILTGSAWGFLYDFVSLCDNKFTLKKHSVNVCPNFEREVFETDIRGIISLRVIHAVIAAIKMIKVMKALKGMK